MNSENDVFEYMMSKHSWLPKIIVEIDVEIKELQSKIDKLNSQKETLYDETELRKHIEMEIIVEKGEKE